jgi:hypothetical protein
VACELCVCFEAADRADLCEQLRGRHGAAAGKLEQGRCNRCRSLFELLVELVNRPCQRAAAGDKLACDPHLDVLFSPREPAADALELARTVESAQRHDQGRVELVQVPAQPLLRSSPLVEIRAALRGEPNRADVVARIKARHKALRAHDCPYVRRVDEAPLAHVDPYMAESVEKHEITNTQVCSRYMLSESPQILRVMRQARAPHSRKGPDDQT